MGYSYPSGLEKILCKWDIHVPLVTKGLKTVQTTAETSDLHFQAECYLEQSSINPYPANVEKMVSS